MRDSFKSIIELLTELGQWLDFENAESVELLVCGGTALGLQGFINRETLDVDVLGEWNSRLAEVVYKDKFSEKVESCIRRVAKNHPGLREDWVNLGPNKLIKKGLPDGFKNRLNSMKFGKTLKIYLLAREDLIALKLYAASDSFRKRRETDIDDLQSMRATNEELDRAKNWMRKLKNFEELKPEISYVLGRLDYDGNPDYI